jgi:hypothetical protein
MSCCKLTICFEPPFWVGLVETEDDAGAYRVARHVFGAEPSDPEVAAFIHERWCELRFTAELQVEKRGGRKISHKRLQRVIAQEVAANARRGTKAQQALSEERDANKAEKLQKRHAQRAVVEQARFEQRSEKRKQKHRGH